MKTRRTEIQIETHEVKIVRLRNSQSLAHCLYCGEIVTALTPEQTAGVLEATADDVFRLLEDGKIHLVNRERSIALICGNSLTGEFRSVKRQASSTSSI